MKAKKMTKKQKDDLILRIQQMVNSDLIWTLGAVQYELDLSEKCIADGDEEKR